MANNGKTIKQIADEIGVSKQRVYRFIKKNRICEAHHDVHRDTVVMYYDEVAETLIAQHFSESNRISDVHHDALQTTSSDTVSDAVIAMLQRELEIKNEQIRELNARLAESSAALVAAQQLAQTAQLLHGGTMRKQLSDAYEEPMHPGASATVMASPGMGLFARIFGRKSKIISVWRQE